MREKDILEALPGILYFLGIVALFVLLFWRGRRARAAIARGDGLTRIAPTLGGEIGRDPSFDGPVVRYLTQGTPTYCHQWLLFEGRADVVTTFECRVPFRAFLEATSERALRYPTRSPRFRDLGVTEAFRVVTTDAAWATETLDGGLRQILRELDARWGRARVRLTIDRFLVEVESALTASEAAFVAGLVARIAALGGAKDLGKGVTFVGEVAVALHGRCPVCGQAFEVAAIHCAQCKVPHHSDCWEYWGRCAIFGCRGRRIALPTSASPG